MNELLETAGFALLDSGLQCWSFLGQVEVLAFELDPVLAGGDLSHMQCDTPLLLRKPELQCACQQASSF